MNDFVIAALFLIMVLAPCVVALQTGVHTLREEAEERNADPAFIPR